MKTCGKCGNENPSSAIHCMKCGSLLVEEEALSEEQKLQKRLQDAEKENELLKAALEAKLKGAVESEAMADNTNQKDETHLENTSDKENDDALNENKIVEPDQELSKYDSDSKQPDTTSNSKSFSNKTLLILSIVLLVIAGVVGGIMYRNNVYLPNKRDAEAPRYYVISSSLKIRNSAFFEGKANIAGEVSYGTELIIYDSVPGEYFYCKFAPHDAKGNIIKDKVIEGYVHYNYILPKTDFLLMNSMFGNDDAKDMLMETRYKKALLEIYKRNNFIGGLTEEQANRYGVSSDIIRNAKGRYQIFCRNKKAESNNVYRTRKYRKDSKYMDVAIILDNLDNTSDRLLLYFVFDDDETPHLLVSSYINNKGYMKDGTLKLYENYYGNYSLSVEFTE